MTVKSIDLKSDEGSFAWTGNVVLGELTGYQAVAIGDLLTITLGGETFSLMVDGKTISRNGVDDPAISLSVISPTAMLEAPFATTGDLVTYQDIGAKTLADTILGSPITWELLDWMVRGEVVAFHDVTPMAVIKTVVEAAGGTVDTLPSGQLRARHMFPVPVPSWESVSIPDSHIMTDQYDNLSVTETYQVPRLVNKVSVRSTEIKTPTFMAEIDTRPVGLNGGMQAFHGGSTAYLLVHSSNVDQVTIETSTGTVHDAGSQMYTVSQVFRFSRGSPSATLKYRTDLVYEVVWYGNSLGALTLGRDGMTLTPEQPGAGCVKVSYVVQAQAFGVTLPKSIDGEDAYPAIISVSGEVSDGSEIICQRGDGRFQGEDVLDPFLTTTDAKRSRGRAIIDGGERLQNVSLMCIHRAGLMPGDLIEVHDSLMGRAWRGKITSVHHRADNSRMTTSLEVLRVQSPR